MLPPGLHRVVLLLPFWVGGFGVRGFKDSLGGSREAGKDQLDSLGGTREAGKDQLDSLRGTREAPGRQGGTREAGKLGGTREAGKDQLDSLQGTREAGKDQVDRIADRIPVLEGPDFV